MYQPADNHFGDLQAVAPSAEFVVATSEEQAQSLIADADIVMGNRYFLQSLPFAGRLSWMQSNSMGVDIILNGVGNRLDNVMLTCVKGLYSDEIADHTLALLLSITRNMYQLGIDYQNRKWRRWSLRTLQGLDVLIFGYGSIGKAIATRLTSYGVNLFGVRRSHIGSPIVDELGCTILESSSWCDKLPTTQILIIAAPLTPETHQIIGQSELNDLPNDAILINIARGAIIDETALFDSLRANTLYGAGLDTLCEEPPGPSHVVWDVPNLILTPHVARSLETENFRWQPIFVENLRRFVNNLPLLYMVDQDRGY